MAVNAKEKKMLTPLNRLVNIILFVCVIIFFSLLFVNCILDYCCCILFHRFFPGQLLSTLGTSIKTAIIASKTMN